MKKAIIAVGLIENSNNNIGVEIHDLFKTQFLLNKNVDYVSKTTILSIKHLLDQSRIFSDIAKKNLSLS